MYPVSTAINDIGMIAQRLYGTVQKSGLVTDLIAQIGGLDISGSEYILNVEAEHWAEKFVDKDDPGQVLAWFPTTIRELNREQLRFIKMATDKVKRDRLTSLMAETDNTNISSDRLEEALLRYITADYMNEYTYLEEVERNNRIPGRTKLSSLDFYSREVLLIFEAATDIIQDRQERRVLKEYIRVNHQRRKDTNEHNRPYYDETARPDDFDMLLSQSVTEGGSLKEEELWGKLTDFYESHSSGS